MPPGRNGLSPARAARRRARGLSGGLSRGQALIHDRTGQVAKTHRGVRVGFLMLTRDSGTIDPELREFLGRAYDLKSRSDYGTGEEAAVSVVTAAAAVAMAERFIQSIEAVLSGA